MTNYLSTLKEDPGCLYIYNQDLSIYDLPKNNNHYLIVVSDDWHIPVEWPSDCLKQYTRHTEFTFNNETFEIYKISTWFDKVLNCDIICWICACLNKKFIIKEHVKLLMTTDILQLRKNFDAEFDPTFLYAQSLIENNIQKAIYILWTLIRNVKFINQIYENHKIVNFKDANSEWKKLNSCTNEQTLLETWIDCIAPHLKLLHNRTDDLIKSEKIKKALKNE